jgi:hypothetical protein
MTAIPNEQTEHANEGRIRSSETLIRPEEFASRLRAQVKQDVEGFSSDIARRSSEGSALEAGMDSQAVEQIRASSDVAELPQLVNAANQLGERTIQSFDQSVARPVASDRLHRALGISRSSMPEVVIQQTPPRTQGIEDLPQQEDANLAQEQLLERQNEERIPPEVFRLKRDLDLASAVERLEQGERLEIREIEMIVGALESRGWQKLFNQVKTGDAVAAFLVPNAEYFSIKRFNDVLFGMQKTDDIIKIRRDLLLREAEVLGLERVATSYKDEYYQISQERLAADGEARIKQELIEAAERMRFSMTSKLTEMTAIEWAGAEDSRKTALDEFVRSMIGEKGFGQYTEQRTVLLSSRRAWQQTVRDEAIAMQQKYAIDLNDADALHDADEKYEHAKELAAASYRIMEQARYTMTTEAVTPALQEDAQLGYRMTFGMSEVGEAGDGDLTHVERAISESLKGAMTARHTKEIGASFSKEDAEQAVERITKLREQIGIQDLADADGRVYPVFEVRPDGQSKVIYAMNLDLIQEIRKGTFKPLANAKQAELFQTVKSYIEAINIFDVTKPYVHEEMAGGNVYGTKKTIEAQIEQSKSLALHLRDGSITSDERQTLATLLRQDGKDRACSSTMEFHKKALTISNCSYISLDVLNVGPELLQEYELLLQRVANGRMSFDEAQLMAGDATTEKMRQFRAQVTEAYRELCHDEEPVMSVGGDEIVLAMDTAKITDEFMLKLRQIKLGDRKGGTIRVVKTAVGTGERISATDGETRMKEHLEAIRRAEDGTAIAKQMEKMIREIRTAINDLPPSDRAVELEALNQLNIAEFAVHQREHPGSGFELILKNPDESEGTIRANLEGKRQELNELYTRLHQTVEQRRIAFYDEVAPTHPKLPKELIPIALRRRDHSEQGYEAFIQAFS